MTRREGLHGRALQVNILIVAIVANLLVGAFMILNRLEIQRTNECVAQWQRALAASYIPRAAAAQDVSEALDEIILGAALDDDAEVAVAIDRYIEVRARQDEDRRENPVPPFPSDFCGER